MATVTSKSASNAAVAHEVKQYATFWIGKDYFGIDIHYVQEILKAKEMTPVPLAPDYICGLINLRGQIVMAIHLERRLKFEPAELNPDSMNLVVKHGSEIASFLVDDIGDVLEINPEQLAPVPPTLQSMRPEFLKAVCKLDKQLLILINVEKLLMDTN